jgi:hypothetical protein
MTETRSSTGEMHENGGYVKWQVENTHVLNKIYRKETEHGDLGRVTWVRIEFSSNATSYSLKWRSYYKVTFLLALRLWAKQRLTPWPHVSSPRFQIWTSWGTVHPRSRLFIFQFPAIGRQQQRYWPERRGVGVLHFLSSVGNGSASKETRARAWRATTAPGRSLCRHAPRPACA